MRQLEVIGVRVDAPTGSPVLLLKEVDGDRCLPIWIGVTEGAAIVHALDGDVPPRPLTHDLLAAVLQATCGSSVAVEITEVNDGMFLGRLLLSDRIAIDARPSDLIALAVRLDLNIACPDELMAEAGVELSEPEHDEVEAFREFLDNVNAEDFDEENS